MTDVMDLFRLDGKTALVTGATGHLGQSISKCLLEAGARVLINGSNGRRVDKVAAEFRQGGFQAEGAVFDVTSEDQVRAFFEKRADKPLHIIVNNAYAGQGGSIQNSESSSYLQSYDISVVAAHRIMQSALPALRTALQADGHASVINIASMYGLVSPDQRVYNSSESANPPFYGAAKAALLQWSRYAACEFGPEGIRVNAISPGAFPAEAIQNADPDFISRLNKKIPLGRIGAADELKGPVLFLASSASSYVNGANLVVDGGWTCW